MFRSLIARLFAAPLQANRSPHWPAARAAWLKEHPTCAVCGGSFYLQVHHIQPFHLLPERELDPANLLTLCESPGSNHHLEWGHFGNFKLWNPSVINDCIWWQAKRKAARI